MNRRLQPIRLFLVVFLTVTLVACGDAAPSDGLPLEVDASIGGKALAESGAANPLPIDDQETELAISLTNVSDGPVDIRYIRIEGEIIDLRFLTFTTRVDSTVAAGETRQLVLPLELFDVGEQAHGYLRSSLRLYTGGDDRELIGSQTFAIDVRGSVFSTMAIFALVLLVATAATLVANLNGLARRRLPRNRMRRAIRLAVSGLGIGLVIAVGFSVLRVFPLPGSAWTPLVFLPTAAGFTVGYLSLGIDDGVDEEDLEELRDEIDDLDAVRTVDDLDALNSTD